MNEFLITEDFPENEAEFDRRFSDERACREYLFKCRWPTGFVCPKCGFGKYWQTAKGLYMCYRCESQHSQTAGTIMHGTRWPLRAWFKDMT